MSSQSRERRRRTSRNIRHQVERLEGRQLLATITEFGIVTDTPRPTDITSGPDGNLWFAETNGNKIGRITTAGTVTEFLIPSNSSNPDYITSGPDGNLWFTAPGTNTIGRITTTGTVTEFTVPTGNSGLSGITEGPDGALWFAEANANQIGRITTAGTITEYASGGVSSPYEIVTGSDGNLWFTEINDDHVGKIVPSGESAGAITLYATSAGSGPRGITAGSDGNLWFTEGGTNDIGKVTTAGVVTEFAIPTSDTGPSEIVSGPGGDLYFAQGTSNQIGRMTTAGTVTAEYDIPTSDSAPDGMTVGPDNNVWFTEFLGNQIGRLSQSVASTLAVTNASGPYGGTTTLQAHLTSGGSDVANEAVDFHLGATDLGSAITNGSGIATISNASLASIHAGSYSGDVTASFSGDSTYSLSNGSADLTVTPAPLTITANDKTKVYGAALPLLSSSIQGLVNGDTSASLEVQPTLSTTATSASHVSGIPYPITASGAVDTDYTISYVAGSLTVTAAPLTVSADNQSKVYGAALPTLTATYTGFVNGDTAASLATPPTITTAATSASHVAGNPYPITASGAADTDYMFSYVAGSLTVTAAPLTVTASNKTKVYGAALPTLTATYTGFVNGDTAASLATPVQLMNAASSFSSVGSYPIVPGGATSGDYAISFVDGDLSVTPAPLTIAIDNLSRVYGQSNPEFSGTVSGALNGDDVGAFFTTSAARSSDVVTGGYPITLSGLTGETAGNYSTTVTGGSVTTAALTVTPAPLTVVVADQSRVYGQANPAATGLFSGALNGDVLSVVYGTAATPYSDVKAGGYAISPTGLSGPKAADYSFSVEGASVTNGTLTVTPAPLAIVANNLTRFYGQANPALTGAVGGVLNNDDVSVQFATSAIASSDVVNGGYPITVGGLSGLKAGDYSINNPPPGTLTVAPAPLTVTADNASKDYGQANPGPTASFGGFVLGQDQGVLSGVLGFATPATTASHVGQYPVTPNGLTSINYAIRFQDGGLSVTRATLTATADDQVKLSGAPLPPLAVSYAGFVNGDSPASLTTPVTVSTTATAASAPGTYTLSAVGGGSTDYAIVDVPGTLTVNPGPKRESPMNDFTGSGRSDLAIYLPTLGAFDVRTPDGADQIVPFGIVGEGQTIPAPGDYDGSGHTELAVYIPSQGLFVYRPANGGPDVATSFGVAGLGMTIPAPGDYDGSGHTELAVYIPSQNVFVYRPARGGPDVAAAFGVAGPGMTIPAPGDYDGSGRTELAVYIPSQGLFVYRPAGGGPDVSEYFGVTGQGQILPTPGDYTGVGHDQLAAYLPAYGTFAIRPGGGQPDIIARFGGQGLGLATPVAVVDQALTEMGPEVSAASIAIPGPSTIADTLVTSKARRKSTL